MSFGVSPAGFQSFHAVQWHEFRNDAGSQIPAHGIIRLTGLSVVEAGRVVLTGDQPNTYGSQYSHAVNGPTPVNAGKYGMCCLGEATVAAYDSADGTPAFGELWGPRSGTWKLKKNTGGFRVVGVVNTTRFLALVTPCPMLTFRGQPTADVSAGASGTVTIYTGAFGGEASTSVTMASVRNDSSCTVTGSQICTVQWVPDNGGWQFVIGKTS